MKRLVIPSLLLAALASWAANPHLAVVARKNVAAGGPTYLFEESFEGAGYENVEWSEVLGNPDEDATNLAADGSQSLRFNNVAARLEGSQMWSAPSTSHIFFAVYKTTMTTSEDIIRGWDASNSQIWKIQFRSDNNLWFYHGSAVVAAGVHATGKWWYVWMDYAEGAGSDGTLDIYIADTTTKPSVTAQITTGTSTNGHAGFYLRTDSTNNNVNIDHILVDDETIGSAP